VIVEPQERGWHLRQLVRVVDSLRLVETETIRRDRRVAVTVGPNEAAVQMGHHLHMITEWREPRVDRNPIGVC
jgi:hypothetical protein